MSYINLLKQNDSIAKSLSSRNITFEQTISSENVATFAHMSEDELIQLIKAENEALKKVVAANKPKPQVESKKEKAPVVQSQSQPKPKETKPTKPSKASSDSDSDDEVSEPVKKFEAILNMEDMKRAFFNRDYETFDMAIRSNLLLPDSSARLRLYFVNYKYSSDNDSKPEFVAKNLVSGFVRMVEDYRKYFMICFRCDKIKSESESVSESVSEPAKYEYRSWWIFNAKESIDELLGSDAEQFEFAQVDTNSTSEVEKFLNEIRPMGDNVLNEKYLH